MLVFLCMGSVFSCTSKHIQKTSVHTDSVSVKKVDSSRTITATLSKEGELKKTQVKKDNTKKTEKIKETTVIEFDNGSLIVDTGTRVSSNGSAEDYLPIGKVKRITKTKTTTRQVDNDTVDSTDFTLINKEDSTYMDSIFHSESDSAIVTVDVKSSDKKVFRFNWWWLLLLIPIGYAIWVYRRYRSTAKALLGIEKEAI